MGTQQQTSGSNTSNLQFNPGAEGLYNALTGSGAGVLQNYINNPLSNPFYNLSQSQAVGGASRAGNASMQSLLQNQKTSGLTGAAGQGWLQAQQAKTGRANQSMISQANLGNIGQAFNRQLGATGQAMSFSPQITGSSGTMNQTQTTGGLGTWLPQLLGAGLGAATGLGGLGSMFGGGGAGAGAFFGGGGGAGNANLGSPGFAGAPVSSSPLPDQLMQKPSPAAMAMMMPQ